MTEIDCAIKPHGGRKPQKKGGCLEGARLSPQELVGRRVRVWWDADLCWYRGTVVDYDERKQKHSVEYDDGDAEKCHMKEEIWRLLADEDEGQRKPLGAKRKAPEPASPASPARSGGDAAGPSAATAAAAPAVATPPARRLAPPATKKLKWGWWNRLEYRDTKLKEAIRHKLRAEGMVLMHPCKGEGLQPLPLSAKPPARPRPKSVPSLHPRLKPAAQRPKPAAPRPKPAAPRSKPTAQRPKPASPRPQLAATFPANAPHNSMHKQAADNKASPLLEASPKVEARPRDAEGLSDGAGLPAGPPALPKRKVVMSGPGFEVHTLDYPPCFELFCQLPDSCVEGVDVQGGEACVVIYYTEKDAGAGGATCSKRQCKMAIHLPGPVGAIRQCLNTPDGRLYLQVLKASKE